MPDKTHFYFLGGIDKYADCAGKYFGDDNNVDSLWHKIIVPALPEKGDLE